MIVQDTLPPTAVLLGDADVLIVQGAVYVDAGVLASDSYDSSPVITTTGLPIDTAVISTSIVTYNVTDHSANAAPLLVRSVSVLIKIIEDQALQAGYNVYVNLTANPQESEATAAAAAYLAYLRSGGQRPESSVSFAQPPEASSTPSSKTLPVLLGVILIGALILFVLFIVLKRHLKLVAASRPPKPKPQPKPAPIRKQKSEDKQDDRKRGESFSVMLGEKWRQLSKSTLPTTPAPPPRLSTLGRNAHMDDPDNQPDYDVVDTSISTEAKQAAATLKGKNRPLPTPDYLEPVSTLGRNAHLDSYFGFESDLGGGYVEPGGGYVEPGGGYVEPLQSGYTEPFGTLAKGTVVSADPENEKADYSVPIQQGYTIPTGARQGWGEIEYTEPTLTFQRGVSMPLVYAEPDHMQTDYVSPNSAGPTFYADLHERLREVVLLTGIWY